jgi:hypothetical protein
MGQISGTAGKLGSFNPITGGAKSALQGIIGGQSRADVSGAAQAAKSQGQMAFNETIAPEINEQFGAMGLGSSSSRTRAIANAGANVGTNVGNTALLADIGAQENALNRQLGGFNPLLQGSGQQLNALQGAGQLQSGQAGLVSNERLAGNALAQNALQFQQSLGQNDRQFQAGLDMKGLGFEDGGMVDDAYASGGRVDEGDFLSNLLYGTQFNRAAPNAGNAAEYALPRRRSTDQVGGSSRSAGAPGGSDLQGLQKEILREQLMALKRPTQGGRSPRGIGPEELGRAASSTLDPGNRLGRVSTDFQKLGQYMQFLGPDNVGAGTRTAGAGFAQMASSAAGAAAGESASKFGDASRAVAANPELRNAFRHILGGSRTYADGGYVMDTDQWDDGGQVNGPSFPPDRVHVMAQGGEGILPLEMMDRLKSYKSDDPMLNEIKGLLFDSAQKQKYAGGGLIHGLTENTYGVDELAEAGGKNYPELPMGSRHHAEGTRKLAELIGFVPTQLAGLGVEGIERLLSGNWGDLGADLKANVIGGAEGAVNRAVPGLKLGTKVREKIQKKEHGGQVLPTGQKGRINLKNPLEVNLGTKPRNEFTNQDLSGYSTPTSQGVDTGIDIDSEIERASLNRANEERRAALYSSLVATSGPAVRAKMAGLINQARGLALAEDEKIKGFMGQKAAIAQAKAESESLNQYRQGTLDVGNKRANVQQQQVLARLAELKTTIPPEQFNELLKQFQLGGFSAAEEPQE